MRITALTMATLTMMAAGIATPAAEQPQVRLTVYLRDSANVPILISAHAKAMASEMFDGIGIRLEWRKGEPGRKSAERPIAIELITDVPPERLPGALACAMPFEGVHIQVFYNRIAPRGDLAGPLLAHVMVHEITHMLEGSNNHSPTRIMKAQWTTDDYAQMRFRPLSFERWDMRLIYYGLAARTGGVVPEWVR